MKILFPLAGAFLFAVAAESLVARTAAGQWFSLQGDPLTAGNPRETSGLVRKFNSPVLRVTRTPAAQPWGTILLLPGGGYKLLDVVNEGLLTAETLHRFGYDVVMLEYHVDSGEQTRNLALDDALSAWRLVKMHPGKLGIQGARYGLMGYSAGGHLAARALQMLATTSPDQQPDDLILIYPAYLDECTAGSTLPLVRPPENPMPRLTVMVAEDDNPVWVKGCRQYVDSWQKSGGQANFQVFRSGGHGFGMQPGLAGDLQGWPEILSYFLENGNKPGVGPFNSVLPWFIGHRDGRLAEFQKSKANDRGAIVFLGDSITASWNLTNDFPEWQVANRGIAGDTTRGMLCRLQDNVLDLRPQAIVLLGGINDLFHPPQGTPETIALNVHSMLEQIRAAAPETPVLVCEILPCKSMPPGVVRAANTAVDKVVADFPNARRVRTHDEFLNSDGTQAGNLFTDGTHLTAAGYEAWRKIMKMELARHAVVETSRKQVLENGSWND